MLNNELLSVLLKFYGDHDASVPEWHQDAVNELENKELIKKSSIHIDLQFYRITKTGLKVASSAIGAANKALKDVK